MMYKLRKIILMILFWLILFSIVCNKADNLVRKLRNRNRSKTTTELEIERIEEE